MAVQDSLVDLEVMEVVVVDSSEVMEEVAAVVEAGMVAVVVEVVR